MTRATSQVLDEFDRPVQGAQVYALKLDGSEAALTLDDGTSLLQPIDTDTFGAYYYNTNDTVYRREIWYGGKKRWVEQLTENALDVSLRSDLAAPTGATHIGGGGQAVTPQQFQISSGLPLPLGGGIQNDAPAIQAAINSLRDAALTGYDYSKGSRALFLPAGVYNIDTTSLDVWHTLRIYGETTGGAGGAATVIKSNDGHTSIRIQTELTSGDSTVTANNGYGGAYGSVIEGIHFEGGYTLSETSGHGILMRAKATVRDCYFINYSGNGVSIEATAGLGVGGEGNANGWRVENCFFQNCKNGLFIDGADVNAGRGTDLNTKKCRQWGVYDSSFLGNTFVGGEHATHGYTKSLSNAETWTPSMVSRGGNWYSPVVGQEVAASTNAPTSATVTITIASPGVVTWTGHGLVAGTQVAFSTTGALPTGFVANTTYYVINPTTNTFQLAASSGGAAINTSGTQSGVHTAGAGVDSAYWVYFGAGGPSTAGAWNVPAWVNAITVRSGGSVATDNANAATTFFGTYFEGDSSAVQLAACSALIGGFPEKTIGALLTAAGGVIQARDQLEVSSTAYPTKRARFGNSISGANDGILTVFNSDYGGGNALAWGVFNTNNLYFTNWRGSLAAANTPFIVSTSAASSTDAPWGTNRMNFPLGFGLGGKRFETGTVVPASGTYAAGDVVWNSAPTASGPLYWVCTVAGTPGTWVANYLAARADPSVGIGYVTGAGGAVTQITSRTTATPAINKVCGQITLFSAAGSATWQTFTVPNTTVAATDTIRVVQASGTDKYMIHVTKIVAATSFDITFATTGGTTVEAPVINFAIIKAVAA